MKTADYYFQGFPAVWNLVVLYLFILRTPEWVNLAVIATLCVLTFVPWKYVHPLRVVFLRPLTLLTTVVWSATTFWLVFLADEPEHPMTAKPLVFWLWIGTTLYFATICALRSIEEGRDEA
jgi:phosphatidylcholine synthase